MQQGMKQIQLIWCNCLLGALLWCATAWMQFGATAWMQLGANCLDAAWWNCLDATDAEGRRIVCPYCQSTGCQLTCMQLLGNWLVQLTECS
jgi:hypothetical protein